MRKFLFIISIIVAQLIAAWAVDVSHRTSYCLGEQRRNGSWISLWLVVGSESAMTSQRAIAPVSEMQSPAQDTSVLSLPRRLVYWLGSFIEDAWARVTPNIHMPS